MSFTNGARTLQTGTTNNITAKGRGMDKDAEGCHDATGNRTPTPRPSIAKHLSAR